jgi:hypothetical protein
VKHIVIKQGEGVSMASTDTLCGFFRASVPV